MSTRQPVRKNRRPATRPAIAPVVPLLAVADDAPHAATVPTLAATESVVAQSAAPCPAPQPMSAPQPAPAATDREALVELHFTRISALLAKAECVAEAMLDGLMTKIQRREQVYPGELIHIFRGLHVLAKCGAELSRGGRKTATLSEVQVMQLETRLRKAFGM